MIEKGLIIEMSVYMVVFAVSSGIPIFFLIRFGLNRWVCVAMALIITLFLINLGSFTLDLGTSKTGEFYEVFWLVPPAFVLGVASILRRARRHGRQRS
jgi:hypothetical protein